MISRRQLLRLTQAGASAAIIGAGDAFAIEPGFRLTVKNWHVKHAGWPSRADPLRIGVLTDIHAVRPWMLPSRISGIVERMNELNPDVIVLLGDYVNALRRRYYIEQVPVAEWAAVLKPLKAPLGVYAILGNHDWWSGEVPIIRRAFDKIGIHLLENQAVKLERGNEGFWLVGLGDQLAFRSHGVDDLEGALSQVTGKAPVILLAHEPDIFERVPRGVSLTLAGHTHGGQVYIPFLGRPAYDGYGVKYARWAYGHVYERGRQMIVSSGLGLSHLPVRFLVPPEIAIVNFSGIST
jgi:predicted MPP superfamily phosphohydrolase